MGGGGYWWLAITYFFKWREDPDLRFLHIVPPQVLVSPDLAEGVSMFIYIIKCLLTPVRTRVDYRRCSTICCLSVAWNLSEPSSL